jgi:hypothetical protein
MALKEMILGALNGVGGMKYLMEQARRNATKKTAAQICGFIVVIGPTGLVMGRSRPNSRQRSRRRP